MNVSSQLRVALVVRIGGGPGNRYGSEACAVDGEAVDYNRSRERGLIELLCRLVPTTSDDRS